MENVVETKLININVKNTQKYIHTQRPTIFIICLIESLPFWNFRNLLERGTNKFNSTYRYFPKNIK